MKRAALTLVAACAVLALQACEVREADTRSSAQSPADSQAQPAPAAAVIAPPATTEVQAAIPVQQPSEPLDAQVATAPQAGASAMAEPPAAAMPPVPPSGTAIMGAPPTAVANAGQGTAAATEMSEFLTSSGTRIGAPAESRK